MEKHVNANQPVQQFPLVVRHINEYISNRSPLRSSFLAYYRISI